MQTATDHRTSCLARMANKSKFLCILLVFMMITGNANAVPMLVTFEGNWTPEQQIAFLYATRLWSSALRGDSTVKITAQLASLPDGIGGIGSGPISYKPDYESPYYVWRGYPRALLIQIFNDITVESLPEHLNVQFNSDIEIQGQVFPYPWYLGQYGRPGSREYKDGNNQTIAVGEEVDFITTALHELGHGLGFESLLTSSGDFGPSGFPSVFEYALGWTWPFDDYIFPLMSLLPAQSGVRADLMRSGPCGWSQLYWYGYLLPRGATYYSSSSCISYWGNVAMNTPTIYEPGSSISHFGRSLLYSFLMAPADSPNFSPPAYFRDLGSTILAMADLGWPVNPGHLSTFQQQFISSLNTRAVSEQSVLKVFNNMYSSTASITGLRFLGRDAGSFTLSAGPLPISILPCFYAEVPLEFSPTSTGKKEAILEVEYLTTGYSLAYVQLRVKRGQ